MAPLVLAQNSQQLAFAGLRALEITSDSSASLDFISLLGTATPSALVLSPASLDFGQALVGYLRNHPHPGHQRQPRNRNLLKHHDLRRLRSLR